MKSGQDDTSTARTGTATDSAPPADSMVDLDALRGWTEKRDPRLQMAHRLPVFAELLELDEKGTPCFRISLHGPDLLLGRFQSQYAPVDLSFSHLLDHQSYRLGAPHAHLSHDGDHWELQALSPRRRTCIAGEELSHLHEATPIDDGDVLTFGVTRFEFRTAGITVEQWRQAERNLLDEADKATLFLKRRGGLCGPVCSLPDAEPLVLGRTFPEPGVLPNTKDWPEADEANWDLSGLHDYERKHIAFRHALIARDRNRWTIRPLCTRQRTFVNRISISGQVPIDSGDEIGLGSVLFRFYDPDANGDQSQPQHVPTVVDWSEGRAPEGE